MIKKFIGKIEEAIFDIDELIVREITHVEQIYTSFASEHVIRYSDVKESDKGKLQGRRGNLVTQPISDDYILEVFESRGLENIICWILESCS